MKKQLIRVAMCAPVGVILGVGLLTRGSVVGIIAPLVLGVIGMAIAMRWMDQANDSERTDP